MAPELINPWIERGLQIHSGESEALIVSKLRDMATKGEGLGRIFGKAMQPAADAMHVWNKAIWDFYHPGLMVQSAETIYANELNSALRAGRTLNPAQITQLGRATADHVGNIYGAI